MFAHSRVTQRQVADEAGVSRTTVSLVLNDVPDAHISPQTRQRVLEVAKRLDYYPDAAARRLASGRTRTIALVWHRGPDRTYRDAFLPGLLDGISRAARRYGYQVLFRPVEVDEPNGSYMELARGHHTDGLIFSGPRSDDNRLRALHAEGFPIVLHGRLRGVDIPSVDVDNVQGALTAVNHLLALGHRRVGMVTNAPLVYAASQQRLEGYRKALREADIPCEEALVREGNFDEESGYAAIIDLLALDEPPSAVFIASDMVAMGALRALQERGVSVPEEIAIVGFDDITAARFITPALTTVHVPTFGLGWGAAELLIRVIDGDQPRDIHVLLDTELIIRESCGLSKDR
jgi:DNA-binding LacI/PurR family transcriptional regulator